ncbi:MAG: glycine/betaine/sarcosine/D-proline family reductase selenoprotein B [Nitrospira sp.]|nr:glycine/betaine/sarcosine/D-proline family reductase selenoprotein B [Nitrospira sp.]
MATLVDFNVQYINWLAQVKPLLEQARWKEAFQTYPYVISEDIPWTSFTRKLADCKVALITTAGVYLQGEQPRFHAENIEGDWTYREIPKNAPKEKLGLAHDHFDHTNANKDINCVFPIDRLKELESEGIIKEFSPTCYSFTGYNTNVGPLIELSIPKVVQKLLRDQVDIALLVAV